MERCLELLRPNERLGMVVPESLITSKSYRHVVQFMRSHEQIEAVIGMPEEIFKTSGKGGTHTKACLVTLRKYSSVSSFNKKSFKTFMAEAKWCGHDSRGRRIDRDDLPEIFENYKTFQNDQLFEQNPLGYTLASDQLVDNILSPSR